MRRRGVPPPRAFVLSTLGRKPEATGGRGRPRLRVRRAGGAAGRARGAGHRGRHPRSPAAGDARAATGAAGARLQVACIDVFNGPALPFAAASFDVVVINGVLEYAGLARQKPEAGQARVLAEAYRLPVPGGLIYWTIENRFSVTYLCGPGHDGLWWSSALSRRLTDGYSRLVRGRRYVMCERAVVPDAEAPPGRGRRRGHPRVRRGHELQQLHRRAGPGGAGTRQGAISASSLAAPAWPWRSASTATCGRTSWPSRGRRDREASARGPLRRPEVRQKGGPPSPERYPFAVCNTKNPAGAGRSRAT